MELTTKDGTNLNTYYGSDPDRISPCNDSTDAKWWRFIPYDLRETINYIIKMLVLPGLIAAIFIYLMILSTGSFGNLTIGIIITVLTYIGSILISFYARERFLTRFHAIPPEDLLVPDPPDPFNAIEPKQFSIGFVGDIMRMRKYQLMFSNDVIDFFKDVDIIVGNLEGIVIDQDCPLTKQSHPPNIRPQLQALLRGNTTWLLCLSNNHSIDFGNLTFHKSLNIIQQIPEIDVFGRNDVPHIYVEESEINISSASMWSNQKTWDCISEYTQSKLNSYNSQRRFNILYPHWNYENERYVRRRIQKSAKLLLTDDSNLKWDLIFGQHTHVRQPIIKVVAEHKDPNNIIVKSKKIIAFSGGNFASGVTFLRKKKHIHGIIMKCDIGPLSADTTKLAVGKVEWKKTFNKIDKTRDVPTKIIKFGEGEQGISRIYIILIGISIIVLVFLLRIFGI